MNKNRFYPTVNSIPEAHEAIKQLSDNIFDLRDQLDAHKQKTAEVKSAPKFTGDIQGIKVKAVTDPSSLQNGFTIRYNASTGEFEFGI